LTVAENHPERKLRFLHFHRQFVYATDLGRGVLYVTDMTKNETTELVSTHNGSNRLKNATGVTTDPAGNVLVASSYHGCLEVKR